MEKQLGRKVRQLRELKGYSQQYMADKLCVSQRAYSKMETNETRLDWSKITKIAEVLEMDPMDMVSFDDNLIFNNCKQSGKFEKFINKIPKKLIQQYESRIEFLEKEIIFLREELNRR
jgi:transcriptional regulator with XRE-family HTH domain